MVTDCYQHHGLGTSLVRLLVEHARSAGVRELVADVLEENLSMLHAFAHAGLHATTTHDYGVAHLVMPLEGVAHPAATPR